MRCFKVSCENLTNTVSVVRDFLVHHEEHEGFGFFLIFYFPLFVLKLFFFVIFVSFVVDASPQETQKNFI